MKHMFNFIFFIIFILAGCTVLESARTYIEGPVSEEKGAKKLKSDDLVTHLEALRLDYISNSGVSVVPIVGESYRYLNSIHQKLVANNELLLDSKIIPSFYIVKESTPFYFSLPGGHFFFSVGIIRKYFKHEDFLVSVLAYEAIKSHKKIYLKNSIVPIGYLSTERMISMTKIPLENKAEINQWAYYVLKRSGFDGYVYLVWLQTINRNTLDFSLLIGDAQTITQEESRFKNFIISQGGVDKGIKRIESNSSKDFYNFINDIERIKI